MKKRYLLGLALLMAIILIFVVKNDAMAMNQYEETTFKTGIVTANLLNLRQGPAINFPVITQVNKDEQVRVFAKIGDWYVIQTQKDLIGAVNMLYIKEFNPDNTSTTDATNNNTNDTLAANDADAFEVLKLINEERKKAKLPDLIMDKELQKVAKTKAEDMVKNNYFSHTSPTYGTPFDMIKSYGITYRTAGENIAGNTGNKGATDAWMASLGHKENILNNAYNYTGIGVVESKKYGKIYVQMFIGK